MVRYLLNAPRCPFHSYHQDGAMRVDANHGSTIGYEPNNCKQWQEQPDFSEPPLSIGALAIIGIIGKMTTTIRSRRLYSA